MPVRLSFLQKFSGVNGAWHQRGKAPTERSEATPNGRRLAACCTPPTGGSRCFGCRRLCPIHIPAHVFGFGLRNNLRGQTGIAFPSVGDTHLQSIKRLNTAKRLTSLFALTSFSGWLYALTIPHHIYRFGFARTRSQSPVGGALASAFYQRRKPAQCAVGPARNPDG